MYALDYLGYDAEYVWHQQDSLHGFDAAILPGGFSYGDYLRCGAIARFSPIMEAVSRFAQQGRPVMGICNGFQILAEARLLPGALIRNKGLKFICSEVALRVEKSVCQWVSQPAAGGLHGGVVRLPINHNEGNYTCDAATLAQLQNNDQIVLRYCSADGSSPADAAPNGALDNIAGICNDRGNVFGLMPHPERVTDGISGNRDGAIFFSSIAKNLSAV
jgi:phosphoribosylformylglycinamidine synthase